MSVPNDTRTDRELTVTTDVDGLEVLAKRNRGPNEVVAYCGSLDELERIHDMAKAIKRKLEMQDGRK